MHNASHKEAVLGIIPARGGSRGIPQKNLALLAGKPLLVHTCDAALRSTRLTRVILSTDDDAIARCGRSAGVEMPFLRPAALAEDTTPMVDVLHHVLLELASREKYRPEIVVLLQPTSPLRTAEHIDAAVDLLLSSGADTVVSVVAVPHQFTPASLMRMEGEFLTPFHGAAPVLRRQDKPVLFARNGPAVLALRTAFLEREQQLYSGRTLPLLMEPEDSVDIDSPGDLAYAEFLLKRRGTSC